MDPQVSCPINEFWSIFLLPGGLGEASLVKYTPMLILKSWADHPHWHLSATMPGSPSVMCPGNNFPILNLFASKSATCSSIPKLGGVLLHRSGNKTGSGSKTKMSLDLV